MLQRYEWKVTPKPQEPPGGARSLMIAQLQNAIRIGESTEGA